MILALWANQGNKQFQRGTSKKRISKQLINLHVVEWVSHPMIKRTQTKDSSVWTVFWTHIACHWSDALSFQPFTTFFFQSRIIESLSQSYALSCWARGAWDWNDKCMEVNSVLKCWYCGTPCLITWISHGICHSICKCQPTQKVSQTIKKKSGLAYPYMLGLYAVHTTGLYRHVCICDIPSGF